MLLLEESAETSANASIGDLNGDGFPDLVLAKGRHWPLVDRVLLNDGHGRFPSPRNLGDVADRSYSVTLADIDRDGDLDVVVGNDAPDPKRVYANDGRGNFRLLSTFGRPEWPTRNATVADLNGDQLPDIIVANRTGDRGGSNFICLNKGEGRFDADCIAFADISTTTITPADVNRDGLVDLIVPHREGGQSHVHLNGGKATFAKRIPFGRSDAAIRVAEAADFNGDGRIDIAAIDERAWRLHHVQSSGRDVLCARGRIEGDGHAVRTDGGRLEPRRQDRSCRGSCRGALLSSTSTMARVDASQRCHSATTKARCTALPLAISIWTVIPTSPSPGPTLPMSCTLLSHGPQGSVKRTGATDKRFISLMMLNSVAAAN